MLSDNRAIRIRCHQQAKKVLARCEDSVRLDFVRALRVSRGRRWPNWIASWRSIGSAWKWRQSCC